MSEAVKEAPTFIKLHGRGLATITDADDFVEAWNESGHDEQCSLADYLGVTDEEYDIWVITPRALPAILAARPLRAFIEPFYRQLRVVGAQDDRPVLYALADAAVGVRAFARG